MSKETEPVVGLLLDVDRSSPLALQEQLESALRDGVRSGRLRAGEPLPSSRGLATQLAISRGVVSAAYGQLAAEGYLTTRQGAPVRIAEMLRTEATGPPAQALAPTLPYDFHPGLPDLAGFPRERWMRSVRAAWRDSPLTTGGFGDPRGAPQLREQLSRYLGRVRGAAADPEHTMVCSGLRHGLSLACRRLREHGASAIAVEDPGAHTHRLSVEHAGLDVVPIPVDDQGIDVAALREHDVGAVIVTSAHQFPTAVVLSPERRSALIAWAAATDSLIIEDDYDSELRFDRVAVGALQGLAPEHVLLIGSAGQRLIPGLRMGWMLSPSWLSWPLIETRAVEDGGPEIVGQLALADFIARGELDRHLKRMRSRYAQSREVLLAALASHLPRARPCGAPAGLHELVMLEAGCDESRLVAAATDDGVALHGLAHHRFADAGPPGLVLGYGNLSPSAIDHGIALLARRSKSASNA